MECGENGCQRHASRSLNIVVEAGNLRAVLVEEPPRVVYTKVFKMDVRFGESSSRSPNELIHKLEVFLTPNTRLWEAQIQFVVKEFRILPHPKISGHLRGLT